MNAKSKLVKSALSRRDFLACGCQTALGACALSALTTLALEGADPTRQPATQVRFGFTTYTWGERWDLSTLIANCQKAGVGGVELRTSDNYAHGVELGLSPQKRREVRKRFADSPVKLVSLASAERMDWPEPDKLKAALESTKAHLRLSRDVGASGVRVFPNEFHPGVPQHKTLEQIARALNQAGAFAADCGQEVRLEAHGAAGSLPSIQTIMEQVTQPSVRVALNCDHRDTQGDGFESNFNRVKKYLGHTLHIHNLKDAAYPYQLQMDLLLKMNWDGWALMEASDKVPDRVQALTEQRQLWDEMLENTRKS